jgi:hypothetical protein
MRSRSRAQRGHCREFRDDRHGMRRPKSDQTPAHLSVGRHVMSTAFSRKAFTISPGTSIEMAGRGLFEQGRTSISRKTKTTMRTDSRTTVELTDAQAEMCAQQQPPAASRGRIHAMRLAIVLLPVQDRGTSDRYRRAVQHLLQKSMESEMTPVKFLNAKCYDSMRCNHFFEAVLN